MGFEQVWEPAPENGKGCIYNNKINVPIRDYCLVRADLTKI